MHARDNPRQLYVSNKEGALMRLLRTGVVRMGDEARRRKKKWFHTELTSNNRATVCVHLRTLSMLRFRMISRSNQADKKIMLLNDL